MFGPHVQARLVASARPRHGARSGPGVAICRLLCLTCTAGRLAECHVREFDFVAPMRWEIVAAAIRSVRQCAEQLAESGCPHCGLAVQWRVMRAWWGVMK